MPKLTPMMEQYFNIKKEYKHCLVAFRLGDFYEFFYDDALIASKVLEIALTGRDCGQKTRAPMCGVPAHSVDGYIARLVEQGHKVAICEQMENPKGLKTIVKRAVTRVVTPGTVIDPQMLEEGKNSYIMCVFENKSGYGIAVADVTTGEFLATSFNKQSESADSESKILYDEIFRFSPREIITNTTLAGDNKIEPAPTAYAEWAFDYTNANNMLCRQFKVENMSGFGISETPHCISACGALIEYLSETQKDSLKHITTLRTYSLDKVMMLDISSRKNLELTESIRDRTKKGSLLGVLDKTKTAFGARLMRRWIEQPILNASDIERRLLAVGEFKDEVMLRAEMRDLLSKIYDIERLASKLSYRTANARNLHGMKCSFEVLPQIKELLQRLSSPLIAEISNNFDVLEDLYEMINVSISVDPPIGVRDGGMIKDGYNAELDRLREAKTNGTNWLLEMEMRERELTGIKSLRVRFNKIFGYCVEVTNSYKELVPERYIRRQTLANCERYTTPELKEIEDAILGADERILELEYELFCELRDRLCGHIERIQLTSAMVATLDVLQSLAEAADRNNYCCPVVDNSGVIDVKHGRHPVVELMTGYAFVPNDILLDKADNRLSIITGPNMAGKSTYMRQAALIVLMAQIGSFVPADSARIGVVDRIFTRVGASDDLATGQSTFMVEMSEVANIIHNASCNSLLILDEIGRGTSTFDGLSIAWAVLEHIAHKIGAKTLFATHYHELTELEGKVSGVKNYCITVQESGDDIVFLRKIARGGADHSYGIYVARIAGISPEIIKRSNQILSALNNADITRNKSKDSGELYYKKKKSSRGKLLLNQLTDLDVDSLTPREALKRLYELQSSAKELDEDND